MYVSTRLVHSEFAPSDMRTPSCSHHAIPVRPFATSYPGQPLLLYLYIFSHYSQELTTSRDTTSGNIVTTQLTHHRPFSHLGSVVAQKVCTRYTLHILTTLVLPIKCGAALPSQFSVADSVTPHMFELTIEYIYVTLGISVLSPALKSRGFANP